MIHCLLYLCMTQLVCITCSTVYHVKPHDNFYSSMMPNTYTLDQLLSRFKRFGSNTEINFLPGTHYLKRNFTFKSVENIYLRGNSSTINCTTSVGLVLANVTYFTIGNITFINCRRDCSQYSLINMSKHIDHSLIKADPLSFHAAVLLYDCELVTVTNVAVVVEAGVYALVGINLNNVSKFTDVHIIIKKSSSKIVQVSSVAFHYHNTSVTANTTIMIKNFHFTLDNTCASVALEVVILQQMYKVKVAIQDTKFLDLYNVIALFYYTELCKDYDAGDSLILDNILVYNNVANCSSAMFNIILQECGFYNSSACYWHKHDVILNNSNFEGNSNGDIFNIFLKQTLVTSVTITIHNCSVFNNTDTQFIVTQSEIEILWQFTHQITLNVVNITHNWHKNGQNLLSFMHAHVNFEDEVVISGNSYYDSIVRLSFSQLKFHGCIEMSNNTAYRLINTCENSYFIAQEAVTLRIVGNLFHNIINYADWEDNIFALNLAAKCQLQFSSPRGNLDDQFKVNSTAIHYNIIVSNNTYVLPKYLITLYSDLGLTRNCTWLAKTSFKTTKPNDTAERFIHHDYSVVQPISTKSIPSKICQCDTSNKGNCTLRQLGSIYPGQTLKVNLTIPTLVSSNMSSLITVRVLSTSEEMCSIDDLTEIYQLKSNHECQEYRYTIKYHTFKTCELYLRTQQLDTEIFFVRLNPCPPGFTLQNNACSCNPLLQLKGMAFKTCDINSGTITRPANSWILPMNSSNSSHAYCISLNCPFDYCLPYESQHDLSDPNAQCQYNRVGLLCGHCKEDLSAVFGSSRCKTCSDTSLFIIIPALIIGIVLIMILFIFNLTIINGTVNIFIFYFDIVNINSSVYYSSHRSFFGLPYGIEICFYNGMTSYAKTWFGLMYPFFIISVAVVFIIASRYFSIVQRSTAHRALPVLATLFLLSYTGILQTVANVIYAFSFITNIPSYQKSIVWSLDTNVCWNSAKFIVTFVICSLISLSLLVFHVVILLNRKLYRFKVINTFKPLLDIYLSPYRDSVFYWVGAQLLIRKIIFVLTMFEKHTSLMTGGVVMVLVLCIQGILQPFKRKFMNIQESVILFNLLAVYIVALYNSGPSEVVIKVLIFTAMICLITLITVHCVMSICGKNIEKHKNRLTVYLNTWRKQFVVMKKTTNIPEMILTNSLRNKIPNVSCNYHELQDPLIELDDT